MPNRLTHETSPYLLQHKENPVDWYPWGEEALEKARIENKPIFLSIGYAACHWCHVMAHESFEDPEIAEVLNQYFINIKVDREERPDLDNIYMDSVVAMTGQGGWPMSVFLTPEGKPFYAGTYFPPTPRYGMPSFRLVLDGIIRTWENERDQIDAVAQQVVSHLQTSNRWSATEKPLLKNSIDLAADTLYRSYDWEHGGWGPAPKFPQPMAVEFLLRYYTRGDETSIETAQHSLNAMSRGGMYDVVGGGFHRYSTDADWLIPHFEKMLYDNAQLALVYLHGYLHTGNVQYRRICTETLDFVQREMMHPSGGFYSSLDADSEGEEGKYYVWAYPEIQDILGDEGDFQFLKTTYGIQEAGNFEGKIVFRQIMDDGSLAEKYNSTPAEVRDRLQRLHKRLFDARQSRIRPGTDDKVLVSWNAMMMQAFAQAGRYLERADYLTVATRNADFLLRELLRDQRLYRSWRDGHARHNAFLEDYAALIIALLDLYQSDPNQLWYSTAVELAEQMQTHYLDPAGGFFDTSDDHEPLITRPKELQDSATPSGNAMAAYALLLLDAFGHSPDWRDQAEKMLATVQDNAARYPTAFGYWLTALDFGIGPVHQIAVLTPGNIDQAQNLVKVVMSAYRPRSILALSTFPPSGSFPPLLADRPLVDHSPTAYVCQHFACLRPVISAGELQQQLAEPGREEE